MCSSLGAKIKKRTYLKEVTTIESTRIKIAFYLYERGQPTTLSGISKMTGLSPQLVNHHLPIMVKEGILLCAQEGDKRYYMLQPFFYDNSIMDSIFASLVPIVTFINTTEFTMKDAVIPKEQAILNSIQILIHFVNLEIEKIKSDLK